MSSLQDQISRHSWSHASYQAPVTAPRSPWQHSLARSCPILPLSLPPKAIESRLQKGKSLCQRGQTTATNCVISIKMTHGIRWVYTQIIDIMENRI